MDAQATENEETAPSNEGKPGGQPRREKGRPMSRRQVKSVSRVLNRETRRVLRRHRSRLSPEAIEALERGLVEMNEAIEAGRWERAEDRAEHVDELLHLHASFARKSARREVAENVTIAVIVALGLRSCVYEPFKIPSGSMLPTLQIGDHIFVNKFVYGVQLPFTNTVMFEDMVRPIQRGDVVVFRYPLDTSQDYIKRVVGVPGDTIRVDGREIWIKGADDPDFWRVERRRVDEPCLQEDGQSVLERCELFEETLGEHTYHVRYLTDVDPFADGTRSRTLEVPEGHLLVLGDNRDQSRDSLQWTAPVEAVSAEHLVTQKDLRDLTVKGMFTLKHPREATDNEDPSRDAVMYLGEHRAEGADIQLDAWRQPIFGADAVLAARLAEFEQAGRAGESTTIAALLEQGHSLDRDEVRVGKLGETEVDQLWLSRVPAGDDAAAKLAAYEALFNDRETGAWFRLRCGASVCQSTSHVARYVVDVLSAYDSDHDQTVRNLVAGPRTARYTPQWTSREQPGDRYRELLYTKRGSSEARDQVRLRVFRDLREPLAQRSGEAMAALRAGAGTVGSEGQPFVSAIPSLGEGAQLVETEDRFVAVVAEAGRPVLFVLECGKRHCKDAAAAEKLATVVHERVPDNTDRAGKLAGLLIPEDVPGAIEVAVEPIERYDWDRVALQATLRGGAYSFSVEVARTGEGEFDDRHAALVAELDEPEAVDALGTKAALSRETGGWRLVIGVPETRALVSLYCGPGLCPDDDTILALGRRAVDKARDASNFIDPTAERARPFVPRGNVKGRADRIWYPSSRFGLLVD